MNETPASAKARAIVDEVLLENARRVARDLVTQHQAAERKAAAGKVQAWSRERLVALRYRRRADSRRVEFEAKVKRSLLEDLLPVLVKRTAALLLAHRARNEKAREGERRRKSALVIQCRFRQHRDRGIVEEQRRLSRRVANLRRYSSARKIQYRARSTILWRRYVRAATALQAWARGVGS